MYVHRLPAVEHARAAGLCPGPGRFRGRLTRRGRINEESVVTASLSFAGYSYVEETGHGWVWRRIVGLLLGLNPDSINVT
jgi:hypothetical protein